MRGPRFRHHDDGGAGVRIGDVPVAAEKSVAGGARRERGAARCRPADISPRRRCAAPARPCSPAAPGSPMRRCRARAGCRLRACARRESRRCARAARSMCSVDSMPAGPCSLSTMTKSTPAWPHISTSDGDGMPTNMPSSARGPRSSSGNRVSITFIASRMASVASVQWDAQITSAADAAQCRYVAATWRWPLRARGSTAVSYSQPPPSAFARSTSASRTSRAARICSVCACSSCRCASSTSRYGE